MKRIAVLFGCLAVAAAVFFAVRPLTRAQAPLDEKALAGRLELRAGWSFGVFADGLGTPRLMALAANGDLIVTIHRHGLVAVVRADRDGDGMSDGRTALAHELKIPHGVLLEGADLYVAEEHRVRRYHFDGEGLTDGQTIAAGLPAGGGHSTRTLKRGPDGKLYIAIGSSCNACLEDHPLRATIARLGDDGRLEVFAAGLRNTVGFDWHPETGALYGVDNGRDRLGDDVPPEELNLIEEGRHYGWPYRFGMDVDDPQFGARRPEDLATTPPVHRFAAHTAPLAIRFLEASRDPGLEGAALVTKHGSWNRSKKAGYAIAALTFSAKGEIEELPFLDGCHEGERVFCRPVDVLEAPDGSLYVSDDFTGAIYKLTYTAR